jgi:LysR family hca operon transcriptional activator
VTSRPLAGEAPTIDLVVGYSRRNSSATLKLFLSRLDALILHGRTPQGGASGPPRDAPSSAARAA